MILSLVLLMVFLNELVSSIPCLSNESKKDFDVARKTLVKVQEDLLQSLNALKNNHKKTIKTLDKEIKNAITNMEKTIKMTTTTLEKQIGTSKDIFTNVEQKLKKLEEDFKVLGRDFQSKYNFMSDILFNLEIKTFGMIENETTIDHSNATSIVYCKFTEAY